MDTTAEKPRTSLAKIETNRRNAQLSTCPKSALGKRTVARNAIKHGIFSRCVVVSGENSNESQSEYDQLRVSVLEHFQWEGFLEYMWAEKKVVCLWQQRRVLRFESGRIAKELDLHRTMDSLEAVPDDRSLPSRQDFDLLVRYGTMVDKQLNHAVSELQKLQSMRKNAG